jgi:hypothetical protein
VPLLSARLSLFSVSFLLPVLEPFLPFFLSLLLLFFLAYFVTLEVFLFFPVSVGFTIMLQFCYFISSLFIPLYNVQMIHTVLVHITQISFFSHTRFFFILFLIIFNTKTNRSGQYVLCTCQLIGTNRVGDKKSIGTKRSGFWMYRLQNVSATEGINYQT